MSVEYTATEIIRDSHFILGAFASLGLSGLLGYFGYRLGGSKYGKATKIFMVSQSSLLFFIGLFYSLLAFNLPVNFEESRSFIYLGMGVSSIVSTWFSIRMLQIETEKA